MTWVSRSTLTIVPYVDTIHYNFKVDIEDPKSISVNRMHACQCRPKNPCEFVSTYKARFSLWSKKINIYFLESAKLKAFKTAMKGAEWATHMLKHESRIVKKFKGFAQKLYFIEY